MSSFTIANGKNVPLNVQQGTVPNMGDALSDWYQALTFQLITKTTTGFQVIETVSDINFWGIVQPLGGRELVMKPEGQRRWNGISVHAQALPNGALLDLKIDDRIMYLDVTYRVITQRNFAIYSFAYYELVEDYTGDVPTP